MNHLYVCSICQVEIEALAKRRRIEIDTFIKVRAGGGGWGAGCQPLQGTGRDLGTRVSQALLGGRAPWESRVARLKVFTGRGVGL